MKTPESISEVCLLIGCRIQDPRDPEEVTRYLEVEPSEIKWSEIRSSGPGIETKSHSTWSWKIHSPRDAEHPVAHRIHALLGVIEPIKNKIADLPKCFWKHLSCLYHATPMDSFMVGQAGILVNTAMMKELIEYDLNIVYESSIWGERTFASLLEKDRTSRRS